MPEGGGGAPCPPLWPPSGRATVSNRDTSVYPPASAPCPALPASWHSDPYRGVYRLIAFTQPARAAAFAQALWAVAGGFDHFPRLILWRHRVELRLGIEAEGFI